MMKMKSKMMVVMVVKQRSERSFSNLDEDMEWKVIQQLRSRHGHVFGFRECRRRW